MVPGISLTQPPRNAPWERPPKNSDPEYALQEILAKSTNKKFMEGIKKMAEGGLSVREITEGLLRIGVSQGMHTVDTSLIIAPVVHERVKGILDVFEVPYTEGFEEPEPDTKTAIEAKSKALYNQLKEAPKREVPKEEVKEQPLSLIKRKK